jgi:hypothetical protein
MYHVTIDNSFLTNCDIQSKEDEKEEEAVELINIDTETDRELLVGQQQTLMWSEEKYLCLAPGMNQKAVSILYDEHAEELSFPTIYLGQPRVFNDKIKVTPYMMATSEIRRRDRRGVTPEHILYMAAKMMRYHIADNMHLTFRTKKATEGLTREMIEDRELMERTIERNFAFLKTIPNSTLYWVQRKKDVFAMMRQLGKPTLFLTFSANETRWPQLLKTLYRLKILGRDFDGIDITEELSSLDRTTLVNEDPVTCCL